ncbi:MAG: hypothetical protein R3C53_08895 [Pirellulaceae bacterium]
METEFNSPGLFSILTLSYGGGFIVLIAQVACIYHVMKHGKPFHWIWLIFFFSIIGIVLYVIIEIRPSLGKVNWQAIQWEMMGADNRIVARRQRLEESPTLKNRYLLADELTKAGRSAEAAEVLGEGMQGVFADDAELMLRVVEALQDCGKFQDAAKLLDRIEPSKAPDFHLRYRTALARSWSRSERVQEAETEFHQLMRPQSSERPAYYFSELLQYQGKSTEARQVLQDIIQRYRRGNSVWRFHEERWYQAAVKTLKVLPRK